MEANSQESTVTTVDTKKTDAQKIGLPEVQAALSKVASNPKSRVIILVVLVLVFVYMIFNMITADDGTPKAAVVPTPAVITKPPAQDTAAQYASKAPALPNLPKLVAPVPPTPVSVVTTPEPTATTPSASTPALPEASATSAQPNIKLPTSITFDGETRAQRQDAKRQAAIMLISGVPPGKTAAEEAIQEDFTFRGDLTYVLGKGKIIDAVLETAINTDFGGDVRAVISRDVFSESGKVVLIPKGSRIFGTYAQSIQSSYGRVDIGWTRVDLPSGYSVKLIGQAVDNLGRLGEPGRLDNKYVEIFSDAVMTSAFNIALANALDKITPPPITPNTATGTTALTSSINAMTMSVFTGPGTPATKMINMCNQVQQLIPDKSSAMYISITASCTQYQNPTVGGTPDQNLQALMTAINSAATSVAQSAAVAITPTQAQTASQAAFKDITGTLKGMIDKKNITPTITVNQGELVRIYVNKDYIFPRKLTTQTKILQ